MIGEIRQIHYGKKYQGMPYQNRNGKVLRISNGNGPKNVLLQLRGKIQVVVPIGNLFEKNRFKADPMPRPWAETEYNDVDLFTGDNREDVERTIELFTDEEVNFVSSPAWSSQYVFEDRRERDAEWSEAADKIRDFGEGYLGDMHAQSDMSGLQRQIVEDCFNGSSGVQRPGLNMPSTPKHLRPEYVQERTGLSFQEADILIECWRTLEATPKMVMSFIRDIIAEPDRQWIEEWTTLSYEVAKVEQPPADYIAPQCETGFDDAVPIMYSRNLARRWEIDPDNFDDENGIDVMSFEP